MLFAAPKIIQSSAILVKEGAMLDRSLCEGEVYNIIIDSSHPENLASLIFE